MPESQGESLGPPQDSLANKITLFVFGSILAAALAMSWMALHATREALLDGVERTHPAALKRAEHRVVEWLELCREDAVEAAAALAIGARTPLRGRERLEGLARVGPDGRVLASTGRVPPLRNSRRLAELMSAREPVLGSVHFETGGRGLVYWLPGSGGGLLAVPSARRLGDALASDLPDPSSVLAVTDESGRILVARRGPTAPAVRHIDPASDAGLRESESAGRAVLTATLPADPGWHIALQTPSDAVFASASRAASRIFLGHVCVILMLTLLAYGVTHRLIRPVETLSRAALRVAEGDLELELPESRAHDELGLLTRALNDMMRRLQGNRSEIEATNRQLGDCNARLQQANEVLNQLSITDGLTKLHNHRFFQEHLNREIKRVSRTREPLSMLLIDIDDFKNLNDRFGHAAGDELLGRIARIIESSSRPQDLLARYGGEEFVILAEGTDLAGAEILAESIRNAVAETSFVLDDSMRPLRVTVSIGVARYEGNRKRFFAEADQALYRAKHAGKDCVMLAE